jgi:hypothetical protein
MRLDAWIPLLAALAVVAPRPAPAQLPDTDIWVAPLVVEGDSVRIGTPRNVTRRTGYDNQPCFLPGSHRFLYASADGAGQTDVYRGAADSPAVERLTATPESEYSPTPFQGPGGGFCAVRVEADSTQRLWRFDADGGHPRVVAASVDSVGYFAWVDDKTVAVFVVGRPHTLRLVDIATGGEDIVARDIGRSILPVPGGRGLSFLERKPDDTFAFFLLPAAGGPPSKLIDAEGKGQDAVWVGDLLLMADGTRLFASRPFADETWRPVADLSASAMGPVTRLAASDDHRWLALVATKEP